MLFEKTKVQKDFSKLNKLIYGPPKSGKSTFAACQVDKDGREPLFITTEDGLHAMEAYSQRVSGWDGFKKLVTFLEKEAPQVKKEYSCLVIDLASDLDQWSSEFVAKRKSVEHLADLSFGKGFALHRQEFQQAFRTLFEILPVTFICHSAEKELQWNGETVKVQAPSLTKGCLEFINGKVDCIMYMIPANTKRALPAITMRNTTMSIAGSRYRQIAREFKVNPNDPAATYREIQNTFANVKDALIEEKDVTPTVSIDPAQAAAN